MHLGGVRAADGTSGVFTLYWIERFRRCIRYIIITPQLNRRLRRYLIEWSSRITGRIIYYRRRFPGEAGKCFLYYYAAGTTAPVAIGFRQQRTEKNIQSPRFSVGTHGRGENGYYFTFSGPGPCGRFTLRNVQKNNSWKTTKKKCTETERKTE